LWRPEGSDYAAAALAAVIFVACSYLIGKVIRWHDHDRQLRRVVIKFCGLMGFFLVGVPLLVKRKRVHDAHERAVTRKDSGTLEE